MNIELNQNGLCLKPKQVVKVRGGRGHSVACHSGSVWVTQEGDPRDIVLYAGESFAFDRKGLALLQALEQGAISITKSAAQTQPGAPAALSGRALAGTPGLPRGAVGV